MSFSMIPNNDFLLSLKSLLPGEEIYAVEEIKKGFRCKKYVITTPSSTYVFRIQGNPSQEYFERELKVSQIGARLRIAPQLIASDQQNRSMLMEHVFCQDWPPFDENPSPHYEAMRLLKVFHQNIEGDIERDDLHSFFPYTHYIDKGQQLIETISSLPKQFTQAIHTMQTIVRHELQQVYLLKMLRKRLG